MKYEVPGLSKTVILPMALLIWAIIAFFWEGSDWNKRRSLIESKNNETIGQIMDYDLSPQIGSDVRLLKEEDFQ